MTTTSSIILVHVHCMPISLTNLTVYLLLTYPVNYKMSVILNVCKLNILKCIMSKYSISVESFSRQGNAFFFSIEWIYLFVEQRTIFRRGNYISPHFNIRILNVLKHILVNCLNLLGQNLFIFQRH